MTQKLARQRRRLRLRRPMRLPILLGHQECVVWHLRRPTHRRHVVRHLGLRAGPVVQDRIERRHALSRPSCGRGYHVHERHGLRCLLLLRGSERERSDQDRGVHWLQHFRGSGVRRDQPRLRGRPGPRLPRRGRRQDLSDDGLCPCARRVRHAARRFARRLRRRRLLHAERTRLDQRYQCDLPGQGPGRRRLRYPGWPAMSGAGSLRAPGRRHDHRHLRGSARVAV